MLTSLDRPRHASLAEFYTADHEFIPPWYRTLVARARAHFFSGEQPLLEVAPRPFVDNRKEIVTAICREFGVDASATGIDRFRDDEGGRVV